MSTHYTCFVISPIGEPHSSTRLAADEAFEYIIKPSLDKYDFTVERADHIRGITDTITTEMIDRIQKSDLCIVDLTGLNPNVMYECGRRHENGKPCILISRDETLPFDVVTHPVIRYSLDASAKDVINTIRLIQQNVQHFVDMGFERAGNRTLNDVYREVGTLNQKLDLVLKRIASEAPLGNNSHVSGTKANEASELIKKLGGAVPAINFALTNRDAELIDHLLPRVPNKTSENFIVGGLAQGASLGSRVAFEMLEAVITSQMDNFSWETKAQIISGYSAGASRLDEERRALLVVKAEVERMQDAIANGALIPPEQQTLILNALQRTYHGLSEYEDAIRVGEQVLRLAPNDEAYLYNQSLNFENSGLLTSATDHVDRLVDILRERDFTESDDDHLVHAIKIYLNTNRVADAREIFLILENQHPFRGQVVRQTDKFKALFE